MPADQLAGAAGQTDRLNGRATLTATPPQEGARLDRHLGWWLVGGGALGLVAATVLLVEKIALLRDPSYVPTCSINPILSCGSVMAAPQAEAFGIPNPIIGVAGFAAAITAGCAVLACRGMLARWFWLGV